MSVFRKICIRTSPISLLHVVCEDETLVAHQVFPEGKFVNLVTFQALRPKNVPASILLNFLEV